MADSFEVQLRRMETSQPWGFRLRGGTDQGMPLFVEHVRIDPSVQSVHRQLQCSIILCLNTDSAS